LDLSACYPQFDCKEIHDQSGHGSKGYSCNSSSKKQWATKSFDEILQKMKMALKVYLFKSLGFICRCSFSDHGRWWRAYKKTVISFQFSIPGDRDI
jgi:hypothetical protein